MERKIYNETKTILLENPDLSTGKLIEDTIVKHIAAAEAIEREEKTIVDTVYLLDGSELSGAAAVSYIASGDPFFGAETHIEVIAEGTVGVEEHDEVEEIYVYIPYTANEIRQKQNAARIIELKKLLSDTDYQAIKYAEGEITAEEYALIKMSRRAWRIEINTLQEVQNG